LKIQLHNPALKKITGIDLNENQSIDGAKKYMDPLKISEIDTALFQITDSISVLQQSEDNSYYQIPVKLYQET